MDILNFISWIRGGRKVTSVDPAKTLIPVGLKDDRRDDDYLAGAISVEDLAAGLSPNIYDDEGNVFIGKDVFNTIVDPSKESNIAIGRNALNFVTQGGNVGIGEVALNLNSTGNLNVAIGYAPMRLNTTGGFNVSVGSLSLFNNTTGGNNVAIGAFALLQNTIGNLNVAVGYGSLERNNKNGSTALGYYAGNKNEGSRNIIIGASGMDSGFAAASDNIAIGNDTFQRLTTGNNNIAIGKTAMPFCFTGSNNIAIGTNADSTNFSGSVIIGNGAIATANNQFVIGSNSSNAGSVTSEVNSSTRVWNVVINGVARKILLA